MGKPTKKNTKNVAGGGFGATSRGGAGKVDLAEIRQNFDGLKDVADHFPDGKEKNILMSKIEEIYISTATWFRELKGPVNEAV